MPDDVKVADYTVGDLVAEFLSACGVSTVFGIASVHNIPMLDGIGRRNAIRYVMTRELGGLHMADGFCARDGRLGVFFSSTGPGAANAVGGLIEAQFAGSPVLHITGQTATKFVDKALGTVHDPRDQLTMLGSVSKSAYRVRQASQALGVLTRRRDRGADAAARAGQRRGADRHPAHQDRPAGDARLLHVADPRAAGAKRRRVGRIGGAGAGCQAGRCCGLAPARAGREAR